MSDSRHRLEDVDLPYVIIAVTEELAQDVDGHYTKASVRFDFKDREDGLIKDGVTDILRGVCIRGYLSAQGIQCQTQDTLGLGYTHLS